MYTLCSASSMLQLLFTDNLLLRSSYFKGKLKIILPHQILWTFSGVHVWKQLMHRGHMCFFLQMFEVAEGAQGSVSSSHTFEPTHQDGVESLAVHRDVFYSGSRDYYIKKWDLASKQLLQVNWYHLGDPLSIKLDVLRFKTFYIFRFLKK